MKIYFYKIPDNSDSQYRGIGFYTDYLVKALKKQGLKVEFFTNESKISVSQDSKFNVQSSNIVHYPWLHPYFITSPLSKKFKRVITIHDLIPLKFPKLYPPGLRAKLVWKINKKIISGADAIITDSLTSKNDILSFSWPIKAKKIHIVPLAPDPLSKPIKNPKLSNSLKILQSANLQDFVLYVGDVNPSKNLPLLVKTCIQLKIPLVLVGNKIIQKEYDHKHPENKDLVFVQKMTRQYPNLLIATGFISQPDLTALYNLATVYCQPSYEEGFGLPVLDAMACACPTAVSQTSALVEITKTNAFLFDPNSLSSLTNALQESLTSSSSRKNIIQAGIKRARQYSWEKTALKTLEVYKQILDNK